MNFYINTLICLPSVKRQYDVESLFPQCESELGQRCLQSGPVQESQL